MIDISVLIAILALIIFQYYIGNMIIYFLTFCVILLILFTRLNTSSDKEDEVDTDGNSLGFVKQEYTIVAQSSEILGTYNDVDIHEWIVLEDDAQERFHCTFVGIMDLGGVLALRENQILLGNGLVYEF